MTPTLVFIPGSLCDAELFRPQIEHFSGSHNIIVANVCYENTMAAMAKNVLDTAPEKFVLIGLSMGGIIAMEVLRQAPERVSHLALLDTNASGELPERVEMRNGHIQMINEGGEAAYLKLVNEQLYPNYLPAGQQNSKIEAIVMSMAKKAGTQAFINQWEALRDRPDSTESIQSITCPTLILCGEQDQLCPVAKHQFLHESINGSTLVTLPDCGHLSSLEKPDAVNQHIAKLIAE